MSSSTATHGATLTAALTAALTTAGLQAQYRPVFARIAEGALDRELRRTLPAEQIQRLKDAGVTRVREPRAHDDDGISSSIRADC
jgi:methylmalonyl-CoA mutase cobalamin-binding subunit